MDRLKQKGWVRYYGVSCTAWASGDEALACLRHSGVSVLQVLVNPLECIDLDTLIPEASQKGVGIVGRQPFHKGAVFPHVELRRLLTQNSRRTAAQTALRFVLERPGVNLVLMGMTRREHLRENLAALSAPPLEPGLSQQRLSFMKSRRSSFE